MEFIDQIPPGSLVADVGCGNGKYLGINPNIYMVDPICHCSEFELPLKVVYSS